MTNKNMVTPIPHKPCGCPYGYMCAKCMEPNIVVMNFQTEESRSILREITLATQPENRRKRLLDLLKLVQLVRSEKR